MVQPLIPAALKGQHACFHHKGVCGASAKRDHCVVPILHQYGMSHFQNKASLNSEEQAKLLLHHRHTFQGCNAAATPQFDHLNCAADHGPDEAQDVAQAAHNLQDSLDHNTDAATSEQEDRERRARVKDLFYAMDKDGNGKLDVGEFRGDSTTIMRSSCH